MSSDIPNAVPKMVKVVERNIKVLVDRRKEERDKRNHKEIIVDSIASFTGSIMSVYIHLIFFGIWILWNVGWLNIKPFDPSFIILALFAAIETIFLSTFVLISQNRMNAEANKRAELDLQIVLLTEHEVTRMMTLVTAMAKQMGIKEADDKEIEELSKDIPPERVLETMEKVTD